MPAHIYLNVYIHTCTCMCVCVLYILQCIRPHKQKKTNLFIIHMCSMKKQNLTGTAPSEPHSRLPHRRPSHSPVLGLAHDDVVQVVTVSPSTTCNIPKRKQIKCIFVNQCSCHCSCPRTWGNVLLVFLFLVIASALLAHCFVVVAAACTDKVASAGGKASDKAYTKSTSAQIATFSSKLAIRTYH